MAEPEFTALVNDIQAHGQRLPIMVYEDQVLDGWHRYKACQQLGIPPTLEDFTGTDPVNFVLSLNLQRRHLTESQRAMVAAQLATRGKGRPSKTTPSRDGVSTKTAAKALKVGTASVERAKTVLKRGTPALVNDVKTGKVSVKRAAKQVADAARRHAPTPQKQGNNVTLPTPAPAPAPTPSAATRTLPSLTAAVDALLGSDKMTIRQFIKWRRAVEEILTLIDKHPSLRDGASAWLRAVADAIEQEDHK
jgi:ParB-like chromosome segregation protein Spo0J